jgi:hypothetical protein
MKYKDFDKQLLAINREESQLRKAKWNLGWEPLVPPVQKGWKRFFILREDVANSREADFFNGILQKINTTDWSWRKNFLVKYRRFGRKKYRVKTQQLKLLHAYEVKKLQFTDKEMRYFQEVVSIGAGNQILRQYAFTEPWRFVLKVTPNMIDKARIKDPALESRIKEIDNYLKHNNYNGRLMKIAYGGNGNNRFVKAYEKAKGRPKKPLLAILETCKAEAIV